MTLCQQAGWALASWSIGSLNDAFGASASQPGGYAPGMWLFTALAVFGLVFSYLLWRAERGPGGHNLGRATPAGTAS
jgi:hypothetical protein